MILILQGKEGLAEGLARGFEAEGRSSAIDLEVDMQSMKGVRQAVAKTTPEAVIMAEGWDDLDGCEADPDRAYLRNAEAAIHVAAACLEFKAQPILLSTAEVFGKTGGPFSEADEPQPASIFAQSRLRGEDLIRRAAKNALILRTGPILTEGLEKEKKRFSSVPFEEADDEYVSPISARELAFAIHALLAAKASGLFHVAPAEPPVPKAQLWSAIARGLSLSEKLVVGRSGRTMARRASRARAPVLAADKLAKHLPRPLASWKAAFGAPETPKVAPPKIEQKEKPMGQRQDIRRVEKPWGHEIIWAHTDRYVGKVLFVKAGERLSLQYHERKDETIYVLSGKMVFEVGPKDQERQDLIMKAGDAYRITPFTTHRMIAIEDTQILEASTPELDDVVRLEDKYGRQGTKAP